MTRDHHQRVLEMFSATFELPPEERERILDRECGEGDGLRAEVEDMLRRHDGLSGFLDTPALGDALREDIAAEAEEARCLVGQRVGDCTLTRVVAAGGMGVVYEAEQDSPRRTVAVKVLHHGLTSRSAVRRFQYESEILAHLRHPHIAQIFEAGTWQGTPGTPVRLPFFVMELIPNARSITRYAREEGLDASRCLALFRKVCRAVQYGHQRGVIHRDLKPDNILVDDQGTPKVIDFGVARVTNGDLALTTMRTAVGQIVGTLQYMSPEQCGAEPFELDTRSDVYSLGMILHELMTGQLPYDVSRLAVHRAIEVIRHQDPSPARGVAPLLRGDLGTITRKALAKERDRRYATVQDLESDLTRFLAHEPISARPPSVLYQASRFARRNRALVLGSVAVVVALVFGLVGTSWQAHKAREEAAIKTAHSEFLHDLLTGFDPGEKGMTVEELVDRAAARVDGAYPDEPAVEVDVQDMLRFMYQQLGRNDKALPHARRAAELAEQLWGSDAIPTLAARRRWGWALESPKDQEAWFRPLLATARRELGEEHPVTHAIQGDLAMSLWKQQRPEEAAPLLAAALERTRAAGDPEGMLATMLSNLGLIEADLGLPDQAIQRYEQAVEYTRGDPLAPGGRLGLQLTNLGAALRRQGRWDEARTRLEEAVRLQSGFYGADHPETFRSLDQLAFLYEETGDFSAAAETQQQLLQGQRSRFGAVSVPVAETLHHLAEDWWKAGRQEEAELVGAQSLDLYHRLDGFPLEELRHAAEIQWAILNGPERAEERLDLLVRAIDDVEERADPLHPELVPLLRLLAREYDQGQDPEAACDALEQCLDIAGAHPGMPGTEGVDLAYIHGSIAKLLFQCRDFTAAEQHFLDALELAEATEDAQAFQLLGTDLIALYVQWNKPDEAREWRARLEDH